MEGTLFTIRQFFVKNSVQEGFSQLNKTFNHAIFLKMDKQYFTLEKDIVLVFTYLLPDGLFVYRNNEQSGIELSQEELVAVIGNNDMDILICGDMNARCGYLLDYLEDEDKYIKINNMSMNEPDNVHVERRSKDKVVSNYGKQLESLCTNFNVHILNGRKCVDEQGEYTCKTSTGKGLVDYMIFSTILYDRTKNIMFL